MCVIMLGLIECCDCKLECCRAITVGGGMLLHPTMLKDTFYIYFQSALLFYIYWLQA